MFQVFENNKPCQFPEHNVDPSWDNSKFYTLEEARKYANHWLGIHTTTMPMEVNVTYNYNGYGDTIEIREVS